MAGIMNIGFENENSTQPAHHALRYGILWLSDGNVVLKTNVYLFKVHKSVLSMQSSVFRDMFALSTTDANEFAEVMPELYEGLHLVSLPDDGYEVAHILRAVYERRYAIIAFNLRTFEYSPFLYSKATTLLTSTKTCWKRSQLSCI